MNNSFKSKSRRLLSAIMSVLMIFAILPTTAFAWSAEEGTQCTSAYGDKYLGSDGDYFYSKPTSTAIIYNEDGSFHVETSELLSSRRKHLIIDSSGNKHEAYCIESGVDFFNYDSYGSSSGKNSRYFQNLPSSAQYGIMLALMYGYQEGTSTPVAGTNNDDYPWASGYLDYHEHLC